MSIVQFKPRPAPLRETLLCLHASGSSGRQWDPLVAQLPAHVSALTPELVGYGSTLRWPTGMPVTLDDEARQLAPLLHLGGVHVFGHSYGAAVALQLALRWPERVKSLTLYEPVRFALLFGVEATRAAGEAIVGVAQRIGQQVRSGALHAAGRLFANYWSGEGSWAALAARQQQALARRMPKVQAEFGALFADRVPAEAYRALTMPVRLMGGAQSPLPARQVSERLAALLPKVSRTTFDGLGHLGPMQDPQRVAAEFMRPTPSPDWPIAA